MPKIGNKTLTFPLAGVKRRAGYREQRRPYSSPWAVNVRGVCGLETRLRGGSRPGMSKVLATDFGSSVSAIVPVTYIDAAGARQHDLLVIADGAINVVRGSASSALVAALQTDGGVNILAEDGQTIVFDSTVTAAGSGGVSIAFDAVERNGTIYLADSTLRQYDPITGVVSTVQATAGVVPAACPRVCLYRDRIILGGVDNVWYASRQSDPADWAFGADMGDVGRAVAGQVSDAGRMGDVIQAMIPDSDDSLLFATRNEIWMLKGDPADGVMRQVSNTVGIIAPGAWAKTDDGLLAFLSFDGVYVMQIGSQKAPERYSAENLPESLVNVATTGKHVTMAYDASGRGFHLFITPETGNGEHWWLDVENKAIWPVVMPTAMQPMATARLQGSAGLPEVILGCRDGYLRKFNTSVATDDGVAIASHVAIGPIRMATNDINDGLLSEIHGILAENNGTAVTWRVVVAASAEEAADLAETGIKAAIAGSTIAGVSASGTWGENRNKVDRCRCRGAWVVIWLSSSGKWAFEAVAIVTQQLGRLRYGY
jgi:hypothetical protein